VADYLLDTNHLSPLITVGHPLRNRILSLVKQGEGFNIAVPVLTEFLFGIQLMPRVQAIWPSGNGCRIVSVITPLPARKLKRQRRYRSCCVAGAAN
jgi:hypothetical protein